MNIHENTPYGHIGSNADGTLTWRNADSEVNPALAGDRARINLDTVRGCDTLRHLMRRHGCETKAVTVEVECFETMEALGLPVNFDEYGVLSPPPWVPSTVSTGAIRVGRSPSWMRADTKIQTSLSRSAR